METKNNLALRKRQQFKAITWIILFGLLLALVSCNSKMSSLVDQRLQAMYSCQVNSTQMQDTKDVISKYRVKWQEISEAGPCTVKGQTLRNDLNRWAKNCCDTLIRLGPLQETISIALLEFGEQCAPPCDDLIEDIQTVLSGFNLSPLPSLPSPGRPGNKKYMEGFEKMKQHYKPELERARNDVVQLKQQIINLLVQQD